MRPFYDAVHRLGEAIMELNNQHSGRSMAHRAEFVAARYVKLVEILKADAEEQKEKTA